MKQTLKVFLITSLEIFKISNIDSLDWKFSSYDTFSPILVGSALFSFLFNNIEHIYSIMIVLITLFLIFTIGIFGYEYLSSYSEIYFITS